MSADLTGEEARMQRPDAELRAARELLGVSVDDNPLQVTHAFRRRARDTHPDVSAAPDAATQFEAIRAAYRIALEAARRREALSVAPPPSQRSPADRVPDAGRSRDVSATAPLLIRTRSAHDDGRQVPPLVAGPVVIQPLQDRERFRSPRRKS
jgi:curved DNA-binding protein CbpA